MIDFAPSEKSSVFKRCYLLVFSFVFATSVALAVIFWHTDLYINAVLEHIELRNGTQSYEWWEEPPLRLLTKIRVFNYTNVEEYEAGRACKLQVEELGPYIYEVALKRENVELYENGSISYRENRFYKWVGGRRDDIDTIRVPNLMLITMVDMVKDAGAWAHVGLKPILGFMQLNPFITLPVKDYLWKYHIALLDNAKMFFPNEASIPDKLGLFEPRNGSSADRYTIHSGVGDLNQIGSFQRINGLDNRGVWQDEECDRVGGTDGSVFPPNLIRDPKLSLSMYMSDLCRKFPLHYYGEENASGLPVKRYKLGKDALTANETSNSCYCRRTSDAAPHKKCAPGGIFDIAPCKFQAPVGISFPHFLYGDDVLFKDIDGLQPRPEIHENYMDVHPLLGVLVRGWSRLQINARVTTVSTLDVLGPLRNEMILPMVWFEEGVDQLPDDVFGFMKRAYFLFKNVEMAFKWGSLFGILISISAIILLLRKVSDKTETSVQVLQSITRDYHFRPSLDSNTAKNPSVSLKTSKR